MNISTFYANLPPKLLEETQKRVDRLSLVCQLHGRKMINERDIFTVFPFHTEGKELDEDGPMLHNFLDLKPPIGRQLQKSIEAWIDDSLRYSQELGENEVDFPVLNLCRHWIGQIVNRRRCLALVGRLYIEKFIGLFAAKLARIAAEISPRITVSADDLDTALKFMDSTLYKKLETIEVDREIFKNSRFRKLFQQKKARNAPVYLAKVSQKVAQLLCDTAISYTKAGKMLKIECIDKALNLEPHLLSISHEIGWNMAAPLDVTSYWRQTPFIHENIAFNGPRAYIIYHLAKQHNQKLAKKLIVKPWNCIREIKQLPAPTRDEIYQACKLAVKKNKDLIDHLLLSNKRDIISCEKILQIESSVISEIFTQIREELFP